RDGEYDWASFGVVEQRPTTTEEAPTAIPFTMIPTDVRFPGMPNPRHWYIEKNSDGFIDLNLNTTDVPKLLVTEMILVHGMDWFIAPFDQELGTAVHTDGIVVTDVFGKRLLVTRAEVNDAP